MSGPRSPWLALWLSALAWPGVHAQNPTGAVDDPGATATAVLVDVVVRDRQGRPVTDLTDADFELREDGAPQHVGSFTRVAQGAGIGIQVGVKNSSATIVPPPNGAAATTAPDAPPMPMTTALVFDALSATALGMCQRAALAYLPHNATADTRVGVFVTEPTASVLQPYTDHPGLVRQAVQRVLPTGSSMREQFRDTRAELRDRRNRLEVESVTAASATGAQLGTAAGNIGGLEMQRRVVEGQLRMVNAFDSLDRDHRGLATTSALFAVLQTLIELPGRKTVVFFSEGLPASPTLQAHLQSIIEAANRVNVTVYAVDASGLRALSSITDVRKDLEDTGNARLSQLARTRDDSQEPLTRAMERAEDNLLLDSQSGLARLAEGTGGFLFQGTNDLGQAFQRIDEDMRFHYLLTYEPTNQAMDGTFRRIGVKVKRRGVDVFARKGYRAVRVPSSFPVAAYEAPALIALDARTLPSAVPFGSTAMSFPEGGRTGLVVPLVRLDTSVLAYDEDTARNTYNAQATIVVRFRDGAGRIVEKVSQQYQLSGRLQDLPAARHGEILFYKEPELAPGVYTMEAAVHDGVANRAGARVSTIEVPRNDDDRTRLSSIVVVRRSEQVQPENRQATHPLQVGDHLLYPATGDPLSSSRDRELAFYFVVYAGGHGGPIPATATIELRRSGRVVSEAPLPLSTTTGDPRAPQVGRIPIVSLPSGIYELVVRIGAAQDEQRRSTFFTVVE
jgi:VWFA-related protein